MGNQRILKSYKKKIFENSALQNIKKLRNTDFIMI
jgi:hypothetical protein